MTKTTFCRICEQLCGLEVETDGVEVLRIRPDKEHPLTKGFACPKGIAMAEIQRDPDRVLHPLRRRRNGTFERVSWPTAIREIGARLRAVRATHGDDSIGLYLGNPAAFSAGHVMWAFGFLEALGTPHRYSAGSQDTNSKFTASHLMYGSPMINSVPDLPRTHLLLVLGANPVVSHGSLMAGGLVRADLRAIRERGGRVVVVDPRRTETAKEHEHIAVRPDGDAWLLLSLINVLFAERLVDPAAERGTVGLDELKHLVRDFTPEATHDRTGVVPRSVRDLARDLAAAPSAVAYGRTGACLGRYGTLVNFLLDAINVLTGNLDRPGGAIFPSPPVDIPGAAIRMGQDTYGAQRSRVGGFPDVIGLMPAGVMTDEIRTKGPGQLRALLVTAGNPVLSTPEGDKLGEALDELDLLVSIDMYVNETNSRADYVLPATTFLERDDFNYFVQAYQYRTHIEWTDAVVPPRGEAREEWTILRDISAELGIVPASSTLVRRLGPIGRRITPKLLLDAMLRTGWAGDRFGLRRHGWNGRRLREQRGGALLADHVPTGVLGGRLTTRDGRVHLAPDEIREEVQRVRQDAGSALPFRLFGRRELRSINSWMHNSAKLNPREIPPPLWMHSADAAARGLSEGDRVRVVSEAGSIEVGLSINDDVMHGSLSLPHAWGHDGRGSWRRANATGGANYNVLTSAGPSNLERLAAMSVLNGVPVDVFKDADAAAPVDA